MTHSVSAKKTSCSGPHEEHACQGCVGPEKCLGRTEEELTLIIENQRLYCLLLDKGMTHAEIRAGGNGL